MQDRPVGGLAHSERCNDRVAEPYNECSEVDSRSPAFRPKCVTTRAVHRTPDPNTRCKDLKVAEHLATEPPLKSSLGRHRTAPATQLLLIDCFSTYHCVLATSAGCGARVQTSGSASSTRNPCIPTSTNRPDFARGRQSHLYGSGC